jgi:hypothetical protein
LRCLALGVLDLLEDLAHAWSHEVALLRRGRAIAAAQALELARIERTVFSHG